MAPPAGSRCRELRAVAQQAPPQPRLHQTRLAQGRSRGQASALRGHKEHCFGQLVTRRPETLDPRQPLLPCLPLSPPASALPSGSPETATHGVTCHFQTKGGSRTPQVWLLWAVTPERTRRLSSPGDSGLPVPQQLHEPATRSAVLSAHAFFTPVAQESHNCVSATKTSPVTCPLSLVEAASQPPRWTGSTAHGQPVQKLGADDQATRVSVEMGRMEGATRPGQQPAPRPW